MNRGIWRYFQKRTGGSGVHSPFVYDFITNVLNRIAEVDDSPIIQVRHEHLANHATIATLDFGAGSVKNRTGRRRISEISASSGISARYGRMLSKIVSHYHIRKSLELGTSLGYGSAYLAMGSDENMILSFEGNPDLSTKAEECIDKLGFANVKIVTGEFAELIETTIPENHEFDLIFIDGNHRKEATLEYFERLLMNAHNDTFFIFDDIRWSDEMFAAWEAIRGDARVNVTIELWRMGIASKRPGQMKEHFYLKL